MNDASPSRCGEPEGRGDENGVAAETQQVFRVGGLRKANRARAAARRGLWVQRERDERCGEYKKRRQRRAKHEPSSPADEEKEAEDDFDGEHEGEDEE